MVKLLIRRRLALPALAVLLFSPSFSGIPGDFALGYYGGFHYWEGADIFQWEKKQGYPRVPKIHSSFYLKFGLDIHKYRLILSAPYFYNYINPYASPDGAFTYSAQKALGMGDVQIGLDRLYKSLGISLFIPGLYTSSKNPDLPPSDSALSYKLEPWRGLAMLRGELRYSVYVNNVYVYGKANVSLWDYSGKAPAESGDSKLEAGVIQAVSEKKIKLKLGAKLSHSRFHWYGGQRSPRVEMELVPIMITGITFKKGMGLNLWGSFTLKRWVFDPVNPDYKAKSISLGLAFSGIRFFRK